VDDLIEKRKKERKIKVPNSKKKLFFSLDKLMNQRPGHLLYTKLYGAKLGRLKNAPANQQLSHPCVNLPTFYEQLLRPNPFAKKLQTQIVST
jgi:hypothetical protein